MLLYVEIADKEVGWMGTVSRLENNCFLIEETFLLEQEGVSAVETEPSVEGCSKLADELLLRGEEGFDLINKMRFWGHYSSVTWVRAHLVPTRAPCCAFAMKA